MIKKSTLCKVAIAGVVSFAMTSCSLKKPDLNKEQAKTFHHMGNFTTKHADYARAADLYKKAYKLDPTKLNSLLALAKVQVLMGKQDEAISAYHKVLKQDKNNKEAKKGLAVAYFSSGESRDAAEQWHSLLNQEPKNVDALNGLGLVMEQIHNYKDAQACFKVALKSAPENSVLLNNLGLNLALQGAVSQGIEQLHTAQKIHSNARLKNNINLLQSIANKEQKPEVLISKLDQAFPKQKTPLTKAHKQELIKYAHDSCQSVG